MISNGQYLNGLEDCLDKLEQGLELVVSDISELAHQFEKLKIKYNS